MATLATKTIQGTSLALEGINDIHGDDGFAASMLSVGDGVTDDRLEKDLENVASLLVNEARDTLDTTTTSKTTDGRLGDTLDIIPKDFTMALGAALSKTYWKENMKSSAGEWKLRRVRNKKRLDAEFGKKNYKGRRGGGLVGPCE